MGEKRVYAEAGKKTKTFVKFLFLSFI